MGYTVRTLIIITIISLFGCTQDSSLAPIDYAWYQTGQDNIHIVQKGETIHSVAFRYDIDYRELIAFNSLSDKNLLPGSKLFLSKQEQKDEQEISEPKVELQKKITMDEAKSSKVQNWVWPTKGQLIREYSLTSRSKGIDISGKMGQAVNAAARGTVAYSGAGVRGYGNLLIIKHTADIFSAYAHNQKLLVGEGELVESGQQIAQMGDSDSSMTMLHFEIRIKGKPLDPKKYLPKRHK